MSISEDTAAANSAVILEAVTGKTGNDARCEDFDEAAEDIHDDAKAGGEDEGSLDVQKIKAWLGEQAEQLPPLGVRLVFLDVLSC